MITKTEIDKLAETYENIDFIKDDPVRVPNRFTEKKILKLQALLPLLWHMADAKFF